MYLNIPKSALIPLGLTAAASATDAAIHKKLFGFGHPLDLTSHKTTLIVSNEEMNDIMKIVKSFEESALLVKGITETIKNEATKKQKTKRRISQNVIRHFRC